jgi:hypothetical protein
MSKLETGRSNINAESRGLKDGGHVIIRCSNCNKPLVDIWRTRPQEIDPYTNKIFEWKFIAECCYCGDASYPTTVLGGFHMGGYGEDKPDESYEKTSVLYQYEKPEKPNVIFIKTARFKQS